MRLSIIVLMHAVNFSNNYDFDSPYDHVFLDRVKRVWEEKKRGIIRENKQLFFNALGCVLSKNAVDLMYNSLSM